MTRRVHLDNVEHAHLRVNNGAAPEAYSVNQVLVVPTEFERLQREYPILFREDSDGKFQSVALLGLDRGENLFVREGEWIARYIPATLRRGPLFLSVGDGADDPEVVIDLDDRRISVNEGEPLFLPHGGAGAFLQQAVEALRTVHEGLELSRTMFETFAELDLIAPIEVEIDLGNGTHYRLANLFTVGADRFARLPGAALERLNRMDLLAAAIHARSSLANVNRLIELKRQKLQSAVDA